MITALIIFTSFAILALGIWLFLYFFEIVVVRGDSMYPTLKDGNIILMKKRVKISDLEVGAVYVYTNPYGQSCVKRCASKLLIGHVIYVWFLGDNAEDSADSRHHGHIKYQDIEGKVLFPKL